MANLFQDIKATFRVEATVTGGQFYVVMDNGVFGTRVNLMISNFLQVAENSAGWLNKVGGQGSPVSDQEIVDELIRINKAHYMKPGISLINELCNRTGNRYDETTHTILAMGVVPTAIPTHLLFGNAFIKVKLATTAPDWGIECDGQLMFISLKETDANALVVWLNQIAKDPSAKSLDIAEWIVRNVVESSLNFEGANLVRKLCEAEGATYNMTAHAIAYPGGTAPPSNAYVDDEWCDDHNDQDTFGIGKPGTKSTKSWEPDVPDPSVDLMKSIRDISDRSRL